MNQKEYMTLIRFFEHRMQELTGKDVAVDIEMVELDSLLRRPRYQRNLQMRKVDQIEANWNPTAAGFLVVNERPNNSRALVDGNHRATVAGRKQETHWPAIVVYGLLEEDEANLWYDLNKTRGTPKIVEVLRAKQVAGDPVAIDIIKTAKRFGYRFAFDTVQKDRQLLEAVGPLQKAQADGLLANLLEITSTVWPRDGYATSGTMLRGLHVFLKVALADEGFNKERLFRVLKGPRSPQPARILGKSKSAVDSSGDIYRNVADQLKMLYNSGLRNGKRIDYDFREK